MESNDSPEIPDRGEDIRHPRLPSGGILKNFLRGKSQENVPLAGMGQDGVAGFGRTREKVSGIK